MSARTKTMTAPPRPVAVARPSAIPSPRKLSPNIRKELYPAKPKLATPPRLVMGMLTIVLAVAMHMATSMSDTAVLASRPECDDLGKRSKKPRDPACDEVTTAAMFSQSILQLPWVQDAASRIPWLHALLMESFLKELSVREALTTVVVVLSLAFVRSEAVGMHRKALSVGGARVLNMAALNRVNAFKEIFWAYLNASLLEPLLSIADADDDDPKNATHKLVVNLFQLAGIGAWLIFVYDAFDTADIQQGFSYRKMRLAGESAPWLRPEPGGHGHHDHHEATGSLRSDICLWLMILGILAAQAGIVSHREGIHAYASVALWCVLHHLSRDATSWGAGYFCTLLMPSAALMPLEYCLLLADAGNVEDLESLTEWREFIRGETGIELIIEHPAS